MIDQSLIQFIRQTTTKLLKFILPTIILLGVAYVFITYNFYTLSVPQKTESISAYNGVEASDVKNVFGIYFIPRATDYLEVKRGDQETRHALLDKPLILIKREAISIKPQASTEKLGMDSLGCDSVISSTVYTYNCYDNNNPLPRYPNYAAEKTFDKKAVDNISLNPLKEYRYKNGVVSLETDEHFDKSVIVYRDFVNKEISTHSLRIRLSNKSILSIDTDKEQSISIADPVQKQVLYLSDLTATPKTVKQASAFSDDVDSVSCSTRSKTTACYYGRRSTTQSGHENTQNLTEADDKRGGSIGTIEIFDFTKNTSTTHDVPSQPVENICLTNKYLTVHGGSSVFLTQAPADTSANQIDFSRVAAEVVSFTCGNTPAFTTSSSIYALEDQSAHLLYRQESVRPSVVRSDNNTLLFNAFIGDSDTLHAYRVTSDNMNGSRAEDFIPLDTTDSTLISEIDYQGSIIYIKPVIRATSDHATGELIINQAELAHTKEQITKLLKESGVPDSYSIKYIYR